MMTLNFSEKRRPLLSDYCQFLLASFNNFTQTYFADHTEKWSHDQLNRLLREERIVKRLPFRTMLIDSWYASMNVMKAI